MFGSTIFAIGAQARSSSSASATRAWSAGARTSTGPATTARCSTGAWWTFVPVRRLHRAGRLRLRADQLRGRRGHQSAPARAARSPGCAPQVGPQLAARPAAPLRWCAMLTCRPNRTTRARRTVGPTSSRCSRFDNLTRRIPGGGGSGARGRRRLLRHRARARSSAWPANPAAASRPSPTPCCGCSAPGDHHRRRRPLPRTRTSSR